MQTPDSGADLLPPNLRAFFDAVVLPEPFRVARGHVETLPTGGYLITLVADGRLSIPLHLVLRNLVTFSDDHDLTSFYATYQPDRLRLEIALMLTPTETSESCRTSLASTTEAAGFGAGFSSSSLPLTTASAGKAATTNAWPCAGRYAASDAIFGSQLLAYVAL
jgi:hypothetical protein